MYLKNTSSLSNLDVELNFANCMRRVTKCLTSTKFCLLNKLTKKKTLCFFYIFYFSYILVHL